MLKNPFSWGAAVLGAIGLALVVAAVAVADSAGSFVVAAGACFVVAGLIWFMAERLGPFVYKGGKVMTDGIKADARVRSIDEADVVINQNPVLQLELTVRPKNKPPFESTVRQMVPKEKAPKVKVGKTIPVRIDPADRSRVIVDTKAL